ncbi:cytochrome c biogenesis CcdA family protein [Tuberibacillus sp. Marseille-P3662]|uniref:cytochrome c biogenesis CcdA family protein n=1 Tax=Tuberibacillus sp. Marseille-P3662 TaxID=1965358 RepID=UPI000A1CDA19|nr:cytochrome c biogenesis protein CcdA [Tuberibacillus sp. Marseille-P3662]
MGVNVNAFLAFGAGLLSFVSPCTLPLYPAFLSYITGLSVDELKQKGIIQKRALLHTLFFLIGFSIVFSAFGFTSTLIGQFLFKNMDIFRHIGAVLIIIMGLMILGVFTPQFLMQERRLSFKNRPSGMIGSVLIGMGFAAGWTPCAGPILVAVWGMAATHPSMAYFYMFLYVIGFAIPFFLLAFFIGKLQWIQRRSQTFMKVGGIIMIILGIMLFFDWLSLITVYLSKLTGFQGL